MSTKILGIVREGRRPVVAVGVALGLFATITAWAAASFLWTV